MGSSRLFILHFQVLSRLPAFVPGRAVSLPKPGGKKPDSGSWDHPLGGFTEASGLGMFLPELRGEPTGQVEPLEHALDSGILLPSFVPPSEGTGLGTWEIQKKPSHGRSRVLLYAVNLTIGNEEVVGTMRRSGLDSDASRCHLGLL